MRHRKGFGVHSPFAFSFITDCVGYPGHYYADTELADACDGFSRKVRRQSRLVFRIVARMAPESAVLYPEVPVPFVVATMLADSRLRPGSELPATVESHTFMAATCEELTERRGEIARLLRVKDNILLLSGTAGHRRLVAETFEALQGGWAFLDTDTAIFISSDHTSPVSLRVKLI